YPDGLTVTLTVSDVDPLMVPLAVVYQAQAAEAGITVEINQIPSDAFWSEAWLIEPFVGSHWGERPADQVLNEVFRCGAAWGETYWCNDEFEQNLDDARTSLDFEDRKAIYQRAQELQSSEGGEIIPFFVNNIRIFSTRLQGVGASYQYSNMPYYLWSISE
ncbi:MAG: peptide ABC transporter substrate-binding protein, partial [Chloroflexi bacterium]|nr:peptide ABC transporter substrate-binding protein [Chloroflexota bacterium]